MTKEYCCVSVDEDVVRDRFEILQKEFNEHVGIKLTKKECRAIAEDMALNYQPEYDYDTALDESIDQYLNGKH